MKKSIAMALMLGGSALATSTAFAQTAPAPGAAGTVAEVVVTAQNRVQSVQDVPIKIDVVSAQQLQRAGFNSVADLDKVAPVAMIQNDQGNVQVTVRGIGNTAGGNTDNSVVTNIDGEYINNPAVLGTALFDLERAEVLRGPQGTLEGRNATGGAVNFIMKKPGRAFGGNLSASYGNYNTQRIDGGLDIPLSPNVSTRFAGFYDNHDGYTSSPGLAPGNYGGFNFPGYAGGKSDTNHAYGGRASIKADALDNRLSLYAAAEYTKRDFIPQAFDAADTHQAKYTPGPGCAKNGWSLTAPLILGQTLCIPTNTNFLPSINRASFAAPANGFGHIYQDTYAIRGSAEYRFSPEATLTYTGGYRHFNVDPKSHTSLPVTYANIINYNRNDTTSHELRLSGTINNVIYQVGGFYFKEVINSFGGFYVGDITPGTTNFGLYINDNLRNSNNESKALFGQVEAPLVDKLTAVVGVRYTENTDHGYWRDKAGFFAGPAKRDLNATQFTPAKILLEKENKTTWTAGLNYKPDSSTLYYAKVSTGFKAGGFDSVGTYGAETNTAYEGGLKKKFGDHGQHFINLTGFYYDYTGLQVNVLLSSAEGGRTFNAGKATIWGAEAETQYTIAPNTHFNASINYLNAELKQLSALYNVYCVPISEGGPGNCKTPTGDDLTSVGDLDPNTPGIQAPSYAGHTPAYSPKWILTGSLDHSWDIASKGTLTARISTTYKTTYFTTFLNYPDSAQKPFSSTDLSLEYQGFNGVTVSAYVRNLEDYRPLTQAYYLAAATDDIYNWEFGTPRTYGVRIGYKF